MLTIFTLTAYNQRKKLRKKTMVWIESTPIIRSVCNPQKRKIAYTVL